MPLKITPKLSFPGILDDQYQKFREQLIRAEKRAKKAAKTRTHR
jgi:hypothetical protein